MEISHTTKFTQRLQKITIMFKMQDFFFSYWNNMCYIKLNNIKTYYLSLLLPMFNIFVPGFHDISFSGVHYLSTPEYNFHRWNHFYNAGMIISLK